MTNRIFDVVVVGVGGVGSATLYQLARRGLKVLGVDRLAPGHARGSSHGETRAIRKAYFEHPDYVPLLLKAYELWEQLNQETAEAIFHQTGILEVGPLDGVLLPGVRTAAEQYKLRIENLRREEVYARFPGFVVPDSFEAIYEPEGGYLLVEKCVAQYARLAQQAGATLSIGNSVKGWEQNKGDILVHTETDTFTAKNLVITAGPWANDLLSELGMRLRVLRKHQHWYAAQRDAYRQDHNSPVFFYETLSGCYYGFPSLLNHTPSVVKVAEHTKGELIGDPLRCSQEIDYVDRHRVEDFLTKHMPLVTRQAMRHAVCMYTMTDDENFIIDRHPEFPNVMFAAGLSGHGFKFASVLGECFADWIEEKRPNGSIEFLSLKRFRH